MLTKVFNEQGSGRKENVPVTDSAEFNRRLFSVVTEEAYHVIANANHGEAIMLDTEEVALAVKETKQRLVAEADARPRAGAIELRVRNYVGKTRSLSVYASDTVEMLLANFEVKEDLPPDPSTYFNCVSTGQLVKGHTLAEYGVSEKGAAFQFQAHTKRSHGKMSEVANGQMDSAALKQWGDKDIDVVVILPNGVSVDISVNADVSVADAVLLAGATLELKTAERRMKEVMQRCLRAVK